jgi:hypothetical protein
MFRNGVVTLLDNSVMQFACQCYFLVLSGKGKIHTHVFVDQQPNGVNMATAKNFGV